MDKVKKFFETEVEKVAGTLRQMWFTISTEHRDRHGDVVVASGWKLANYKKNPVVLWAHDYWRPPIAKTLEIEVVDGKLRAKAEFVPPDIDPFAEQVRRLYEEKFMRTTSVGFISYKREDLTEDDKKQRPEIGYGQRLHGELLEFSAVPVPANPMALQNGFMEAMAKGLERPRHEPKVSKLLRVDSPEMFRASMLLLLGARGGIPGMGEHERRQQFDVLKGLAEASQVSGGTVETAEWGDDPEKFRKQHGDLWDGAVLDILQHAEGQEPEPDQAPQSKGLSDADAEAIRETLSATATTLDAVKAVLTK